MRFRGIPWASLNPPPRWSLGTVFKRTPADRTTRRVEPVLSAVSAAPANSQQPIYTPRAGRAADHPAKLERDNRQAMSNQHEQNEELTRSAYDWFNREKEPPPIWLPDGEFINAREDPDHATYRGIDAIRKQHEG